MAKGRMINRTIALSEKIVKCSRTEQWYYFRLMPFVDDEGRLPGNLFAIKNLCFPAESLSEAESRKYLSKLHDIGLVKFAEDQVIEFVGFIDNQKIGHRPAKSQYPAYQEVTGKDSLDIHNADLVKQSEPALTSIKLDSLKSFKQIQHLKLSDAEYQKLVEEFGGGRVDQIIDDMRNYAKLKNYTSAYLTARKWLNRNKETAPKPQQLSPEPQKHSYFCEGCNVGFTAKDGKCPTCGSQGL